MLAYLSSWLITLSALELSRHINRLRIVSCSFSTTLHTPSLYPHPCNPWRAQKSLKQVDRSRHRCKSTRNGALNTEVRSRRGQLMTRSFQDALRTFFPPIKTNDPRLDFYTIYNREATEYDLDYVKKYDDDLNTTLIFVRSGRRIFPLTI